MIAYLKRYGFLGSVRLVRDLLFTLLFFRGARIVRFPWYVRGAGRVRIGSGFTSGVGLRIDAWGDSKEPCLFIGKDVQVNDHVHIGAIEKLEIGDNVLIASRVFISDHNHGRYDVEDERCVPEVPPNSRPIFSKPVRIERNVWIGEQVCILPGVTIGEGAIIGAGAVVVKDVPPMSIVVGNPARVIRVFNRQTRNWDVATR